ncbi:2'-5' RNA ligase [Rhizomicrobium palustre]|uniref:RNA 2',3'-cyclic phosphodiesterase n=1 Tax=Rhizomicrobium palustre TaxID=189966 RepID=A0A846N5J7_9PROT|nr:RNA 2',3'-cyclic phosphodiesterase [Rhizomicrobium palustre]NIK90442.1 2'-5' RNA ligase [Rhizomicrobium palustre]
MRLFVALPIPDEVASTLWPLQGGVPGARWQKREQLHLTLRFIGEVDGHEMGLIDDALAGIMAPGFTLQLKATGSFGGNTPRDLWAGVAPNEKLSHLQKKIESACQRIGLESDGRRFTPHVTLARLKHAPFGAVGSWLTQYGLYASPEFEADSFCLYSSKLTTDGSIYRIEKEYPLYF